MRGRDLNTNALTSLDDGVFTQLPVIEYLCVLRRAPWAHCSRQLDNNTFWTIHALSVAALSATQISFAAPLSLQSPILLQLRLVLVPG